MENNEIQGLIIMVIMVGLIIVIGIFIASAMQSSFTTAASGTVAIINETLLNVNDGSYTDNVNAGKLGVSCIFDVCSASSATWNVLYSFCLQEFTNDTAIGDGICNKFYNGTYLWNASGWTDVDDTYDGNIVTYGWADTVNTTAELYINYTLPLNVTNNSVWVVSDGSIIGAPWYVNLTISDLCWTNAQTDGILKLRVVSNSNDDIGGNSTEWYCWRGT